MIIIIPFVKAIGYSMEDQQQQQDDMAVQPRRSSLLVESPLTNKETRINTNKNKSPFVNRRLLPTQ
jgi:hypothetical protein